jgi:DNA replicative helicase MCM subunit Mcm2 (Cdc46/Mcm family)
MKFSERFLANIRFLGPGPIPDAIQEGKIPFGKYGFNMTLDGSATFIMSANPTNNSSWRNAEKINLNEVPLISPLRDRFDLFFVFRTVRDRKVIADYA